MMSETSSRSLSGALLARHCAARAHAALGPRMPEGIALATWFTEVSSPDGPEEIIDLLPTPWSGEPPKRLTGAGWQRLGRAIGKEEARPQTLPERAAEAWGEALSRRLALDPLDSAILALALQYAFNHHFERLFDMLSQSRGGPPHFHRNPRLFGLLLGETPERIECRLAGRAKLLTSGLLHPGKTGNLSLPHRLVALIRAGVAPIASHSEACSFACSRTMRTARSRTSGKYRTDVFCFSIALSSQGLEPLANPARFK